MAVYRAKALIRFPCSVQSVGNLHTLRIKVTSEKTLEKKNIGAENEMIALHQQTTGSARGPSFASDWRTFICKKVTAVLRSALQDAVGGGKCSCCSGLLHLSPPNRWNIRTNSAMEQRYFLQLNSWVRTNGLTWIYLNTVFRDKLKLNDSWLFSINQSNTMFLDLLVFCL